MKSQPSFAPPPRKRTSLLRGVCRPSAWAALVFMASTWACTQLPAAQTATANPARAATTGPEAVTASRQVLTQLLVLSCKQHADCATVGVGARACGGPEQYLAYALRDTPAPALQQAQQNYARLRKKQLEERGEMSTCELLPDPGAECNEAGLCQLLPLYGRTPGQLR